MADRINMKELHIAVPGKNKELVFAPESAANKVVSFSSTPDDVHYPSEKLVKSSLDSKIDKGMPLTIAKLHNYLYETFYESLDYELAYKYFKSKEAIVPTGGCSSIRKGNFVGRNFDAVYSNELEFIVHSERFGHRHASTGVSTGLGIDNIATAGDLIKIIPFVLMDGINEKGVFACTHIVPLDRGNNEVVTPISNVELEIPAAMLVRFILDNFDNAEKAVNYIKQHVKIFHTQGMIDAHFNAHYMIGDEEKTYVLEFIEGAIVASEMEKPYMTNFHLTGVEFNADGTVYTPATKDAEHDAVRTNKITKNGQGLERYNLINSAYSEVSDADDMKALLDALKYTNAYKPETSPYWFTEFTGIDELHTDSDVDAFTETVAKAQEMFEYRSRDPESEYFGTWQTQHAVIYDIRNRALCISVQENTFVYPFNIVDVESLSNDDIDKLF